MARNFRGFCAPPSFPIGPGDRVESGSGEDYDTGTVLDGDYADRPAPGENMRWIGWDCGVKTWTHVDDLKIIGK
jgi:hypothetical protein